MVSLNKIGLLNNIQSIKIYKKDNPSTTEGEKAPADFLNADIVAGFGYLISSDKQINVLLNNELFNRGEFNLVDIDSKRDILTGNYKRSEIGETGISNPFFKEGTE